MYIHKKTEKLVWWISVQMEDTYMLIFLLQKRGKIKKQFLLKCLKFSAKFMGSLRFFFPMYFYELQGQIMQLN